MESDEISDTVLFFVYINKLDIQAYQ
jgi:hypothetical protein